MKKYRKTFFVLLIVFFAQSIVFTQTKPNYSVSLYGKINFCNITIEEKIIFTPIGAGEMLFETLKYDKNSFGEKNLILFLLSGNPIAIQDAKWEKDMELLDDMSCEIRFLEANEETINTIDMVLYRLDIKKSNTTTTKDMDILNKVFLNSSIIKVWTNKEKKTIIKISIMYNGLEYVVTSNS
ncbi:MAG TPA: hypothetical protein EYO99_01430 [Candidatus Marinimicrobia bacterium]|nr:hypothetical protein [Candidatus Neomarinimicrobiota bacterium]